MTKIKLSTLFNKNSSIAIIFILFLTAQLTAQEYGFKNFGAAQGLEEGTIMDICQLDDGQIAVGTLGGLHIFNGLEFKRFSQASGLISNYISTLLNDSGKLLIGARSGISVLDDGQIQNFKFDSTHSSAIIYNLLKLGNDSYLLSTNKGIFNFSNGKIKKDSSYNYLDSVTTYQAILNQDKSIDFFTNNGIFKTQNGTLKTILLKDKLFYKAFVFNNQYYLGTNSGVLILSENDTTKFDTKNGLANNYVYDIVKFNDDIWVATDGGLTKIKSDGIQNFVRRSGLNTDRIYSLFVDKSNYFWIGTDHGLNLFKNENILQYSSPHGVKSDVWTVYRDENQNVYAGTDGEGLIKLNENRFEKIDIGFPEIRTIWHITGTSSGLKWLATDSGVYYGSWNKFNKLNIEELEEWDDVFLIFEDSEKNTWFATYYSGIIKYDGKSFQYLKDSDGLNHSTVYSFCENEYGIWVGSERGVNLIKDNKVIRFEQEEILKKYNVLDMDQDQNGNLFLATYEAGVIVFNPSKNSVKFINEKNGLNNNSVMFLNVYNGFLYVGTNSGLNLLSLDEFYNLGSNSIIPFNEFDGILGLETYSSSEFIDENGILWYANTEGIVRYDLTKGFSSPQPSVPVFTELKVNFEDVLENEELINSQNIESLELEADRNFISVKFSSVDFDNPTLMQYSYTLMGRDYGFTPFTYKNEISFANLPPGDYTLEVMSKNRYGITSNGFLKLSFYITPPIYSQSWFIAFAVLLGLILIAFIYKFGYVDVQKRNRELESLYEQRLEYEKELEEAKKDYIKIFQIAHEAILILNPDSLKIMEVNSTACKLYGYNQEEFDGMPFQSISTNIDFLLKTVEDISSTGELKGIETSHKKKNGVVFEVYLNATVVMYKGRKSIVGFVQDVSEQKAVEKKMLEAKNLAESSNKIKSDFLAQMSHEIRSPINIILNFLSLIKEEFKGEPNEDMNFAFGAISRAGQRITRTIDLILNVSEIQTGTYEASFINVNLAKDILLPLVHDNRYHAEAKNLKLKFIDNTKNSVINGDNYTITQVFANLIDNSIKYTQKGKIIVSLNEEPEFFVVSVEDTGIGIEEEYLPLLFDPFTQEQQGYTRKFEGNGLGLSLVKGYCDINNAQIHVTSKKGVGTKFIIKFRKNN